MQTESERIGREFVGHFERKLPETDNYKIRTTPQLEVTLAKIEKELRWIDGYFVHRSVEGNTLLVELGDMYRDHRRVIVGLLFQRCLKGIHERCAAITA